MSRSVPLGESNVAKGPKRLGAIFGFLLLILASSPSLAAGESLQSFLNDLMRGQRGAVVVARPLTGELLAVWNRRTAFERAFPPGSAAKLVESVAALEEGLISPSDRILCRRVPELLGEAYHCSHPVAQEPFTLALALANSCNYFFAALSARLSSSALAHWYAVFGLGNPGDGVQRQGEEGQVRVGTDPSSKARAALGEGTVTTTPAQLLLAYAAIAGRGKVFRLHAAPRRENSAFLLHTVRLQQRTLDVLNIGLEECVRSGTCQAAAVPGVRVAGKTGTATNSKGSGATHAWFVGYAPADSPEVALVVFLERGTGMRDAAPLAGQILQHYFSQKSRRL